MPKRRKIKKRSSPKTKKTNFLARGSITIVLLLGIIIVGSIYFVRGALPDFEHIDIGERRVVVPSEEQNEGGNAEDSLQLRTIQFEACEETAAVDFLLDRTGSMRSQTPSGESKMEALKNAVITFINNLPDSSVIGVQSFADPSPRGVPYDITNDIPISLKSDFPNYDSTISALPPGGFTPTHEALAFSLERLQNSMSKFPDRQFAFIFVSDGQPDPSSQDPRNFNPDPSVEIKNLGVEVYSIGILSRSQINDGEMEELLTHIASSPDHTYISPQGEDLEQIVAQIAQDLCESVGS